MRYTRGLFCWLSTAWDARPAAAAAAEDGRSVIRQGRSASAEGPSFRSDNMGAVRRTGGREDVEGPRGRPAYVIRGARFRMPRRVGVDDGRPIYWTHMCVGSLGEPL